MSHLPVLITSWRYVHIQNKIHCVLVFDQDLFPLASEGIPRTTSSIGCREFRWSALELAAAAPSFLGLERAWDMESCSRDTDFALAAR